MKEKLFGLTILLTVVGILGFGYYTTFASINSGYDTYKEALKETHKMKSGVTNIEFSIVNNNNLLQDVTVQTVHNLEEKRGLANINLKTSDQDIHLQINKEANKVYFSNNEANTTYTIESNKDPAKQKEKYERYHNKELMKIAELVVDTLTRPLHDSFVLDSDQTISVDITNDEIPAVIQTIGTYMVKNGFKHHSDIELSPNEYPFLTETYIQEFPTITDEIIFEQVEIDAELTKTGLIDNQQTLFRISGKDQDGQSHTLTIQFNIDFENINETTVEPLSLENKSLETFQLNQVHHFH